MADLEAGTASEVEVKRILKMDPFFVSEEFTESTISIGNLVNISYDLDLRLNINEPFHKDTCSAPHKCPRSSIQSLECLSLIALWRL